MLHLPNTQLPCTQRISSIIYEKINTHRGSSYVYISEHWRGKIDIPSMQFVVCSLTTTGLNQNALFPLSFTSHRKLQIFEIQV